MNRLLLIGSLLAGAVFQSASGVESLPSAERKQGGEVQKAFEPLREVLQASSAVVLANSPRPVKDLRNKDRIAFGTVMSADGYILTKASELEARTGIIVRVDKELFETVKIVATDPKWDLALLKVDAENLTPLEFTDEEPNMGTWVVANGASGRWRRRVKIGIMSAKSREVTNSNSRAVVGVTFKEGEELTIESVHEKSGAAEAGVMVGDKIVALDGEDVESAEDLRDKLSEATVGEFILLGVDRAGEKVSLKVELRSSEDLYGKKPPSRNDGMSGRYSERRSNFPWIMQHEIPFSRISAGGPLINLEGKGVGLNIARANRAETFAIPTKQLLEAYENLVEQTAK